SPHRLATPLLRRNGRHEAVSWEEALATLAGRISGAVSSHGPRSLFYLNGTGSMYFSKLLLPHLFEALGGCTLREGNQCSASGGFGLAESFGEVPVTRPEFMAGHSRGVLLWGRNVLETHTHAVPLLKRVRERGGEIASIEIRETPTTRFSDRWWRINPGGDWALAAWMCKRLTTKEGWRERATNSEAFGRALKSLDDGELLEAARFSSEDASSVLRWLEGFAPVVHYAAFGAQRYMHGDAQFRWIGALATMLGAFDGPGAGLAFSKDEHSLFPKELLPAPRDVRRLPVSAWQTRLDDIDPPVEVMIISCANPARQSPGSDLVVDALRRLPFTVCIDFIMSDTAHECDLVLPTTTFLEEEGDWLGSYWHNYLVRTGRVLPPRGEALEEAEIFTRLACELGLSVDIMEKKREMDRLMLTSPLLEQVGEGVYRWDEPDYWTTTERKVLLPESAPTMHAGKGLRLVSVHKSGYINGQSWDAPDVPDRPVISVGPEDADSLGLAEGDGTVARSGRGAELEATVRVDPSIGAGYCVIAQGTKGVNTLLDPLVAPGFGAPYAEGRVTLRRK
ncbi:MAG: molybdopterin-dependent oxidoreductase, partial [Synergistaceae bacterium]|nr:molybdopterin-dependent oxidoreductase [Synergistaceae bacterium]